MYSKRPLDVFKQQSVMITSTARTVIRHVGNVGRTSSVITLTVPVVTGVVLVTREINVIKVILMTLC
jgi:hypothetical protein